MLASIIVGRPGLNLALAAAASCGAFWEFLGYFEIPAAFHTMVYAVLGVGVLAVSRFLGIEQVVVDRYPDPNTLGDSRQGTEGIPDGECDRLGGTAGRVPARLMRWASHKADLSLVVALAMAILAAIMAAGLVPAGSWRRWYTTAAIGMAGVTFLTLDVFIALSIWQKTEFFGVAVGILLVAASYVGRFREATDSENDIVTVGLWLGSVMITLPLLAATIHGRLPGHQIAGIEELVLIGVDSRHARYRSELAHQVDRVLRRPRPRALPDAGRRFTRMASRGGHERLPGCWRRAGIRQRNRPERLPRKLAVPPGPDRTSAGESSAC